MKGPLNSELIYEVIVSSKMPTKNYRDFCPESLLEGRAETSVILGWHFGRNNDLIMHSEFNGRLVPLKNILCEGLCFDSFQLYP